MPRKQQFSKLPVKKTGQQNEKLRYEDKFVSVTEIPLIQLEHDVVSKKLQNLSRVLIRHACVWNKPIPNETAILRNYIQYFYEYYEFDQFDPSFETLPSLDVNLYSVSNEVTIYKSYNIFANAIWPVRFNSKFVSKMATFAPNQIKYVLSFILLLAEGNFYGRNALKNKKDAGEYGYVLPVQAKSFTHNRFFILKLFRQKNLLFSVGVEKMPIVRGGTIKRYQYSSYIQILDVLADQIAENPQKTEETVQRFVEQLQQDVAKRDHGEELIIEQKNKKKSPGVDYMFIEYENPYIGQIEVFATEFDASKKYDYRPLIFKPSYASLADTSSLIFDKNLKRWVSTDYLTNLEQKALNEYQRKVNEELIKRFVDFQSAKTLVELLTKIPNFRVQLTQQQKDVIGENGNVLVIGRSGTGKTTCAVLRLFAIQMLFKIRLSLSKKKHQQKLKDTRCSADDIDKTMGLHCVFLTASPVLTNEIERYYKKLTENIKLELEKKKKAQELAKKQQEQNSGMKKKDKAYEEDAEEVTELKPSSEQSVDKEEEIVERGSDDELEVPEKLEVKKSKQVLEEEEQMNKQLGGIQLEEKIENEQFEEDEQNYDEMKDELEEKMRKFKSLSDLQQEDYPGFFTVKSFIMMIDGTLPKPFFIRKSDTTNEESQATWHNQKKGVMMIENYYRNEQDEKKDTKQEVEIEEEINYSDEEELEHEYMRQIQLRENKQKQNLTDKLKRSKKALSFEVDYDYFLTYFWPNVRHHHYSARNITAHLVWTEIYSTIKGGASAHLYPGFYLTQKAYINESTNAFLTKEQKLDVYETFCQYERWKISNGGYDMMDAVNYILNFIRFRGYSGPEVHYVMIDEVQDLPHSIIYLLSKTVRYGVFYSGDTAQTIAKGIGFRFCDLKNLFDPKQFDYSLQLKKPVVKQLTVNFRSHNNILQLANSVVSSIEILFPKTIDRLKKQVSNLSGPKPMILAEGEQELLFYVLCGDESYKKQVDNSDGLKKPPLEFGCDQVIIVRDQESKSKIPTMLQHALCLTIYEAKGLEFNDVILFNFFAESKCVDKWNLLKFLKVAISQVNADDYEKQVTKHAKQLQRREREKGKDKEKDKEKAEEEPEQVDVECIVDRKDNKLSIKKLISDAKIVMKDINDYAELCSELKMLYTAITRPKNTLIIYDDDSTARKSIEKLWQKLEVVELVSNELIEESNKKKKPESQELKIFKSIVNSTNSAEWKKQGMKMYARGYFEQAMKCFQRSGNQELFKKAQANYSADCATKKLIEIESQRKAIANKLIQYQKMSDSDLAKLKKKLKKQELLTFSKFQEAGKIFEELLMFKQAGQCYFSGRKYQTAYENFSKAFMNKQAAESLQMLNKYREASEYYQKEGLYLKVIQCLDMINEWELILRKIQKFSNQMTDLEKKSLFKKYSALALQELVYQIEFQNEPEESKPENNRVEVIKEEEDSEEEDWDSNEDPELAAERSLDKKSSDGNFASRKLSNISGDDNVMRKLSATESEPRRKQSQIQQKEVIMQSVYQNVEEKEQKEQKVEVKNPKADQSSFADLNESSQHDVTLKQEKKEDIMQSVYDNHPEPKQQAPLQKVEKSEDNSFAQLNESSSSFADLNSQHSQYNAKYPAELEPDIQSIRSMADPEDPWLQSALSEIQARTNTEYSIVDEEQSYNHSVRIIKTKGNIVVQDEIMRKIVGIVSIVNESVDEFFRQFKGYQSLITVAKTNESEDIIDNRPEITEFEDVDPKFINIILDTLESFKLYKLCLFVCNRYHLPHKAGRYLVSMALKYSTNSQINNTLNPALIAPSLSRKFQLEKGILASIALHSMFQNVSPDFLKIKVHQIQKQQSKNSLGSYFIEGLILEGLYKKAVFMVNPEESLKILKNFCDVTTFQSVYKQKFLKKPQEDSAEFLSYLPKSDLEEDYTIVKLGEVLNLYNIVHRLDTVSQRYYKQFNLLDAKSKLESYEIPNYAPCLQAAIKMDKAKLTQVLAKEGPHFMTFLKNGPRHRIFDTVAFLTMSIKSSACDAAIFDLKHAQFLQVICTLRTIRQVLRKKHIERSFEIIQSILAVFGCRMIDPCRSSKFINDGYALIHRTSTICNQFVEELKKNKDQVAFFFEQDYNYVLVKSTKLIEIVAKRFDQAYCKFLRARVEAKLEWVGAIHNCFLSTDFETEQSEYLLKALLRQELKTIYPKEKKVKKESTAISKKVSNKPSFNFKTQGRPELVVDLESSEDDRSHEQKKQKFEISNFFIFPDLNPHFKCLYDLSISSFHEKFQHNNGKMISGRLLYCSGLNDSYKEYIFHRGGNNLYDAIEFRKFHRLDLYADNILSVIGELSYSQRHLFSAEILIHLLVQFKCLTTGKNFKLDIPRRFLKFFNGIKLIEVIGLQEAEQDMINQYLNEKKGTCVFSYQNLYSSQYQSEKEIAEVMCEFLEILKAEDTHKCYSIQKLILILLFNMPPNQLVYEALRDFIDAVGYDWSQPILIKLRGASDYKQFMARREKIVNDKELMKNCQLFHEVRVTDRSNIDKDIAQSEKDYQIKEKIIQARAKAVNRIAGWWRMVKKKAAPADQVQIIKENRIIKMSYGVKYIPYDDRFILRSTILRDDLLAFYLRNVVTSSLDYHFILMTLNQIEDLRSQYIRAYQSQTQAVMEVQEKEVDFEEEITNIESTVVIWKNDSKWIKDRNVDLKRKKVFEVKWMTKNSLQKILKKRAGMSKQKKLEDKKKFLKKHLL